MLLIDFEVDIKGDKMFELALNHIKKYMDSTLVLEDINFQIYSGEKVGIVGVNGSGKTTILKLIAGILPLNCYPGSRSLGYDEGSISMPRDARVSYLNQIPEYPEGYTVEDVLKSAFASLFEMEKSLRKMEAEMGSVSEDLLDRYMREYSSLMIKYENEGGYDIAEKMSRVCSGLKLDEVFLKRQFSLLSGGEKTTVILGKILLDSPDILLLDEPTNHLDIDAIEWLEVYLKNYSGIVIVVSHDRYFLDNVVEKIIEIEDMVSSTYKGNYSDYTRQKEELMMTQFANFKEQQKQIAAMKKAIKDLRDWAMRSDNGKFFRRAASIQKKLDKMEKIEKPKFDRSNMKLSFSTSSRSGNETIIISSLFKKYDDKNIFDDASLMVEYGESLALIGANGSGKTTLFKMLLGEESPCSGKVSFGSNVMHAYLPQVIKFDDEEMTVLESFRDNKDISEGKAREYLSKYMFYGPTPFKKVRHLSGGERVRLKLANLLYEDVNVLLLDEPTNHLDIDSIETLEDALSSFKGTVVFISHDRYFIKKMAERIVAIESGKLKSYDYGYDEYRDKKKKAAEEIEKKSKADKTPKSDKKPPVEKVLSEKQIQKSKETKRLRLENEIKVLEQELELIEKGMNENPMDFENLNDLYKKRQNLSEKIEMLMGEWMELS